jgi:DNA-binding transcriptional regulator YiaG
MAGCYLYVIAGDDEPFYVGIGSKSRMADHLNGGSHNAAVNDRMKELVEQGKSVRIEVKGRFLHRIEAERAEVELVRELSQRHRLCNAAVQPKADAGSGPPSVADEVIAARQNLGLTRTEFARALELGPRGISQVQRWEKGTVRPNDPTIKAIRLLVRVQELEKEVANLRRKQKLP